MTEITVFLKGGKPIGFDAHGHTGYAECGEDIVCAAVSAITQTAAMGVSEPLPRRTGDRRRRALSDA